jgi:RHS repeat-associated protein
LNRVKTLGSQVASYAYMRDAAGKMTDAGESSSSSNRSVTWSFDGINRLTKELISNAPSSENGSVSYGLDPVGNRQSATSSISALSPVSGSFNQDDELASETYDQNGNVTRIANGNTFGYDSENHLMSMGSTVALTYDGDGNRVAKTMSSGTTRYLVDDLNPTGYPQVVEELNGGGAVQRQYTYGLQRISQYQLVSNTWTPSFYGYDGFGTVRQLTNSGGTITDSYDYDAFGKKINSTGTTPNNYLYRGEQYDSDLGLYYLRARYYNPATGRFMSRDPEDGYVTSPASLHKYIYAGGDPVNGWDPSGRATRTAVAGGDAIDYGGLIITSLQAASGAIATRIAIECAYNFLATGTEAWVSFGLNGDSGKVTRTNLCKVKYTKDECWKRYMREKQFCERYYDPDRQPWEVNLYAMCMSRAQARYEACRDGLDPEGPGPLDPLEWPEGEDGGGGEGESSSD